MPLICLGISTFTSTPAADTDARRGLPALAQRRSRARVPPTFGRTDAIIIREYVRDVVGAQPK
jgi:hypothetical protein